MSDSRPSVCCLECGYVVLSGEELAAGEVVGVGLPCLECGSSKTADWMQLDF